MTEILQDIKIKAGPIEHLTDARYFAAFGVDWLSFCFDQSSPSYISPDLALQIKNWLSGPAIVGQFKDGDWENAAEIAKYVGLAGVQVPHKEVEACSAMIDQQGLPESTIIVAEIGEDATGLEDLPSADRLLFQLTVDFGAETSLERIAADFSSLRNRLILKANFNRENLVEILSSVRPYAINLSGGIEQKTGLKDYEQLDNVLELLREES